MADRPDFTFLSDVDVVAQSVALLAAQIDILSQSVGIYLQPEWAALTGIDKTFGATALNKAPMLAASFTYNVPGDKTLYICGVSMDIYGYTEADRDNNQIGCIQLNNATHAVHLTHQSLNGGGGIIFPKPLVIPGGERLGGNFINRTNHSCNINGTVWGYEL